MGSNRLSTVQEQTTYALRLIARYKARHDAFMRSQNLSEQAIVWVWWEFEADNYARLTRLTGRRLKSAVADAGLHDDLILSNN